MTRLLHILIVCIVFCISGNTWATSSFCEQLLLVPHLPFANLRSGRSIVHGPPPKPISDRKDIAKYMPTRRDPTSLAYLRQQYASTPFEAKYERIPDLRDADHVRFLTLGDSGYALRKTKHNQVEVARAMRIVMDSYRYVDQQFDFVAFVGDILYDPPAKSHIRTTFRHTPEEFRQSFLDIYPHYLGESIPLYVWVGNHEADHVRRIEGLQATIDFNHLSDQYVMIDGHWGIPHLPSYLRIGGINSNYYDSEDRFLADKHQQQMSAMLSYFTEDYPENAARLNILMMHHPPFVCGKLPNPCQNGTNSSVFEAIAPFVRAAKINNIYAGHVHELSHITGQDYELFTSGGGGARLMKPNQKTTPDRRPGEFGGDKIFNFHERSFGFTVTTVYRRGVTIVDFYGFRDGESAEDVRLLYSQIFESFDSFGLP